VTFREIHIRTNLIDDRVEDLVRPVGSRLVVVRAGRCEEVRQRTLHRNVVVARKVNLVANGDIVKVDDIVITVSRLALFIRVQLDIDRPFSRVDVHHLDVVHDKVVICIAELKNLPKPDPSD